MVIFIKLSVILITERFDNTDSAVIIRSVSNFVLLAYIADDDSIVCVVQTSSFENYRDFISSWSKSS